jgi:hypothetical protein
MAITVAADGTHPLLRLSKAAALSVMLITSVLFIFYLLVACTFAVSIVTSFTGNYHFSEICFSSVKRSIAPFHNQPTLSISTLLPPDKLAQALSSVKSVYGSESAEYMYLSERTK